MGMSPTTSSSIWRRSMQSPDKFAIMDGLRPARARRAAQNLRLSTLTFECNHERVTRATRTDIVVVCRRRMLWLGTLCNMCRILFSIIAFKKNSDFFDDSGNWMYVARLDTRKHGRFITLRLKSFNHRNSKIQYLTYTILDVIISRMRLNLYKVKMFFH